MAKHPDEYRVKDYVHTIMEYVIDGLDGMDPATRAEALKRLSKEVSERAKED